MNGPLRIAVKIAWMTTLLLAISLFAREVVDFVYTGF